MVVQKFRASAPHSERALRAQTEIFEQIILANSTNDGVVRLCERLLAVGNGAPVTAWGPDATPGRIAGHFGKVFLADNGSTGVEIAIKMAIHYQQLRGQTQRDQFVSLQGGYHGETVATLALGDLGLYGEPYEKLFFPVEKMGPLPWRAGPHDSAWQDASAEWPALEAWLAPRAERLAAIAYEPVLQGAGGMQCYSPDLLTRLRQWADANGVLLIADEIASGFGRSGAMLASHLATDGLPDLAIVGKGLTSGYLPLSAVLIPDAIYQAFLGEYHSYKAFMYSIPTPATAAVAVANAVLDVYATEDVLGQVAAMVATCANRCASSAIPIRACITSAAWA